MSIPARDEESLLGLGREVADEVRALVRAEVGLLRAHLWGTLVRVLLVVACALAAAVSLVYFVVFFLGTVAEGTSTSANWPLLASLGCVLLGAILLMAGSAVRWQALRVLIQVLGVVSLLACFVFLGLFYWLIFVATGAAAARIGWAIISLVFLVLTVFTVAAAGLVAWRLKRTGEEAIRSLKEDAEWLRELPKQGASSN